MIFVTHGHHFNRDAVPPMQPGDILLHGHTHVPAWEPMGNDNLYVNPGSVSIPKEGSAHSYLMLTEDATQWKDLDGAVYHEMEI